MHMQCVTSSHQQISLLAQSDNERKFIAIITLVIWVQLFLVGRDCCCCTSCVHSDDEDYDIANDDDNPEND